MWHAFLRLSQHSTMKLERMLGGSFSSSSPSTPQEIYKLEEARKRASVERRGEGVKVNRCIIVALLNKHTCVFASIIVWTHKNWIFIILLSFDYRRMNFKCKGFFIILPLPTTGFLSLPPMFRSHWCKHYAWITWSSNLPFRYSSNGVGA